MTTSEFTQEKPKINSGITDRLIYFFVFILLISFGGFYKTYLIKFPDFDGFTLAHHFHGAVMLAWILMLIAQPVFIRTHRLKWHRAVGKASYFVFPLLLLSLFFVARASYLNNIKTINETEALARMTTGIPDIFYLSILYGLGIYYKKKTSYHLRFFASIGLMILGPGLGRFLIIFCGLPPMIAIPCMIGLVAVITVGWLIIDIIKKRSAFPMGVFLAIIGVTFLITPNSHSGWWQGFAKWIATNLF
jgi:uncharacterized membrane protein YoaK (UPF0700 family)